MRQVILNFLTILGLVIALVLLVGVLFFLIGPYFGTVALGIVSAFYGWVFFAFFHYRQARQAELIHVLRTATEAEMPLAPALRAYLRDRPQGGQRELWIAILLFFVFPGYYWFWHRRHSFDRKVADLADLLEQGFGLDEALRQLPALTSHQTRVLVKVGLSTGKLATCLRGAEPGRIAAVWLEIAPRAAYPLALLMAIFSVLGFYRIFLLPKFQKIFVDFGMELPPTTRSLFAFTDVLAKQAWFFVLLVPGLIGLAAVLLTSATACWFFPGIGSLYRGYIRGRVLGALGVLLDAGRPAPAALALLADTGAFSGAVERRIDQSRVAVEEGMPLPEALRNSGLISRSMGPLLRAALRAQNLSWALAELSDAALKRTIRLMRRISQVMFPVTVVAIGLLVGFVVVAMFMPLIAVIGQLAR